MEQYKERVTEAINEEKEQNLIKVSDLKDVPAVVHFNNYFKYYIKVTPRIQQFFNSVPLESSILVIYKENEQEFKFNCSLVEKRANVMVLSGTCPIKLEIDSVSNGIDLYGSLSLYRRGYL